MMMCTQISKKKKKENKVVKLSNVRPSVRPSVSPFLLFRHFVVVVVVPYLTACFKASFSVEKDDQEERCTEHQQQQRQDTHSHGHQNNKNNSNDK